MIVRTEQLDQIATQRTLSRIAEIIGSSDPIASAELSSEAGRAVLLTQVQHARSYGLESELDLARYAITAWLLGVDFDTKFPAMQEVLTDVTLSAPQKTDLLEKFTVTLLQTLAAGRPA